MSVVDVPPISKENNEDSGEGILFKVDLSNSYELFSTLIDHLVSPNDIRDILNDTNVNRQLRMLYFKCIAECVVLYADIDHMTTDNYQMIEDVYSNCSIEHYDVQDPILKRRLQLLAGIVRYKFVEFINFPSLFNPEAITDTTLLFSMESLLDTIVKNIITKVYSSFTTSDNRKVNMEAGDDIQLISWTENVSNYDWMSHNLNANVILTLKLVA